LNVPAQIANKMGLQKKILFALPCLYETLVQLLLNSNWDANALAWV
jgi:hypothetical protein